MNTTIEKRIMNFHIDSFNIVHHGRYIEFLEEGRWHYCYTHNLINEFHSRGIYHVVVNLTVDYNSSAAFGNIITIETGLYDATERSVIFKQVVTHNDKIVITADVKNVFLKRSDNRVIRIEEMVSFWNDLKHYGGIK